MKTKTVNIYSFSELSDTAKDKAKIQYASLFGFDFADDMLASIKALAEHFNGKVKDYSLDWFNNSYSSMDFSMPEMEPEEIETKLNQLGAYNHDTLMGLGDCKLTGYCGDESAIDGFRKSWFASERDLNKLMQSAFKEWLKDAQADCESQYEDKQFSEHCDANEYEFTESGDLA